MENNSILTHKEMLVINKKLNNKKLSQQDSNCLSRFVRPKLRKISQIDSEYLLKRLSYNPKSRATEEKIRKIILANSNHVQAIILFGSAVQTNYSDYNDIDILVVTQDNLYNNKEKYKKIKEIKSILQEAGITADIQIYSKKTINSSCLHNPTLIYQLNDCKLIYGDINFPKGKKKISNAELHMKLDWSDIYDSNPRGNEIYKALRNTILVRLLLNKIVDNQKLQESLNDELGKNLIERLKNNQETKTDRKIALIYLKDLIKKTREEIKGGLWESIEL